MAHKALKGVDYPKTIKGMYPFDMASSYIQGGPYTLKWNDEDWCYIYQGCKRVWSCNGTFARSWFTSTNPYGERK